MFYYFLPLLRLYSKANIVLNNYLAAIVTSYFGD